MCRAFRVPGSQPPGGYVRVCSIVGDGRYRGWRLWYVGEHAPAFGHAIVSDGGRHLSAADVRAWPHGRIERGGVGS